MKFLLKLALTACVLLQGACFPVMQHGPWVREGFSGSIVGSGVALLDDDGGNGGTLGLDGGVRYGWLSADSTGPGVAVGMQVPFVPLVLLADEPNASLIELVTVDAYVTGPRTASISTALGLNKSMFHTMPYVQLGSRTFNPKGWYTTQALLFLPDHDAIVWLPSMTWLNAEGNARRSTHITVGGALGAEEGIALAIGIVLEFHRPSAR